MPQCSIGGDGHSHAHSQIQVQTQAQARTSFVDKIHGITDKLQHSLGGHLTHDPSKTGKYDHICIRALGIPTNKFASISTFLLQFHLWTNWKSTENWSEIWIEIEILKF